MKKLFFTSNTQYLPYIQVTLTLTVLGYAFLLPQSLALWVISLLGYFVIGCFGISIGYHRLLTHKSFKTTKFWEYFCTVCGMLAFTGSSIGWVGMHRDHHKYSDRPGDPHSPRVSGLKMLIAAYDFTPNKWAVRRLISDKFHTVAHEYYFGFLMLWTLLWAVIDPTLMMHLVIIPGVISVWVSTTSNFMNHKWGYVNFKTGDTSKNNWLNALITFGEGWHNNHHARPGNYNFGSGTSGRWWELDLGAKIVDLIKTN